MLKKLRRRLRRQRLAAAVALAVVLAAPAVPTRAALPLGPQTFSDGAAHTINGDIVATVPGTRGIRVENAGTSATMTGYSITAAGDLIHGAHVEHGGAVMLTGVAVMLTGDTSVGLFANNGGTIAMAGGSITTTGNISYGAYASDASTITLTGATVATTGNIIHGAYAFDASTIAMDGGSITTTGNSSHGAVASRGSTTALTGVSITTTGAGSYALYSYDIGTLTATVNGQDIYGADGLISAVDLGTVNLTANGGSRLYGTTTLTGFVGGAGMAHLTLNGNSLWTMPGDSALTTLTLSGGRVAFTAPAAGGPYKTLTVTGNLAGSGGTFYLNANPAAGAGDLITVTGNAGGSHQVAATIRGGVPANRYQTLKLTNITGTNVATFSGGGDAGAWRYGVAQGSALTGYGGVGSLTDYYLYNTFAPSTPAKAAIGDSAAGPVLWYGEINEIKKRLGELRLGAQSGNDFWVRTYADKFDVRPGGEAFGQIVRGIEAGRDNPQGFTGGKKFTGFVAGAGEADNTFSSGGNGEIRSVYAGAYGSWLRDDGSYFDLIGKYNWFRHSFNSPIFGGGSDSGSYRNKGLGLSAEIGKRIERGNGVFIQPEAELSALWSGSASYTSAGGLAIEVPSASSLQFRLGCTVGRKWQGGDSVSRQLYGKVSWVDEFRGMSRTVVDSVPFDASLKGHQWMTGVGFAEDGKHYQLYLDVEKSWGTAVSKAWGVNAGYRWKF